LSEELTIASLFHWKAPQIVNDPMNKSSIPKAMDQSSILPLSLLAATIVFPLGKFSPISSACQWAQSSGYLSREYSSGLL
jgi:hypothetical protein